MQISHRVHLRTRSPLRHRRLRRRHAGRDVPGVRRSHRRNAPRSRPDEQERRRLRPPGDGRWSSSRVSLGSSGVKGGRAKEEETVRISSFFTFSSRSWSTNIFAQRRPSPMDRCAQSVCMLAWLFLCLDHSVVAFFCSFRSMWKDFSRLRFQLLLGRSAPRTCVLLYHPVCSETRTSTRTFDDLDGGICKKKGWTGGS